MNKIIVIIGIIALLGVGGILFYNQTKSNTNFPQPITSIISVPQQNTNSDSNASLDKELENELNQLDKDIGDGSKDSLKDSDFNF